ncbi:MAG TPA: hypothetical protein VIF15_07400 [Polyangiaceae bacterium]|jgi:hypothetical protein
MQRTTIDQGAYRGPERRRHTVFVTHNSEYHCRDGVCVAVRNRTTGQFALEHDAIGRRLTGSLRLTPNGVAAASPPDRPGMGEQLCFSSGHAGDFHDLITSSLQHIERPPKKVVKRYPAEAPPA